MDYRLYVLNSDGKFADVEEWRCASDEAALEQAVRRAHAYGAEGLPHVADLERLDDRCHELHQEVLPRLEVAVNS